MITRNLDVCIIGGCGHVGLPLGILLAQKGRRVGLFDINNEAIDKIKTGSIPFMEEGAEPILRTVLDNGLLTFSDSPEMIRDTAVIIMIIGTPVDEHLDPKFSDMKKSIREIVDYSDNEQLLILRSTVFPGMTKRIRDWMHEFDRHMDIAFCPERILEGKAMEELKNLPQIVSSYTQTGITRASEFFRLLTDNIVVVEPMEAELAKLYSNVWRYIKFAVSNQFYTIANDYGVDFYNIHHAMTFEYPRCRDLPRPGFAAGPCLFKDTMQLGAFSNNEFEIGHAAMLINEGLPNYVFKRLKAQYDLSTCTVGILGMAFKAESDDTRESLSFKVKKLSEFEARRTLCSDPYVRSDSFVSADYLVEESDIIIIATPHKCYKNLKVALGKKVVDVWNILGNGARI